MDAIARYEDNVLQPPYLKYEAWREWFQSTCGRFNPDGVEPAAFTGWAHPGSVFGFNTLDLGANTSTMRRSYQDVRLDGVDQYFVVFHVGGKNMLMKHNDQEVRFARGNVILLDGARPMTSVVADNNGDTWNNIIINLPRTGLFFLSWI
jgi:AraC family transcriptional regulator, positive regulator of tynA and feaB